MTTTPVHRAFSKVVRLSKDDSLHALDRVTFATAASFIVTCYSYRITPSYQTTQDILKKERDPLAATQVLNRELLKAMQDAGVPIPHVQTDDDFTDIEETTSTEPPVKSPFPTEPRP